MYFGDILWHEIQSHSDGIVEVIYAFSCSMFCMCTRSHLPHNVMHLSTHTMGGKGVGTLHSEWSNVSEVLCGSLGRKGFNSISPSFHLKLVC